MTDTDISKNKLKEKTTTFQINSPVPPDPISPEQDRNGRIKSIPNLTLNKRRAKSVRALLRSSKVQDELSPRAKSSINPSTKIEVFDVVDDPVKSASQNTLISKTASYGTNARNLHKFSSGNFLVKKASNFLKKKSSQSSSTTPLDPPSIVNGSSSNLQSPPHEDQDTKFNGPDRACRYPAAWKESNPKDSNIEAQASGKTKAILSPRRFSHLASMSSGLSFSEHSPITRSRGSSNKSPAHKHDHEDISTSRKQYQDSENIATSMILAETTLKPRVSFKQSPSPARVSFGENVAKHHEPTDPNYKLNDEEFSPGNENSDDDNNQRNYKSYVFETASDEEQTEVPEFTKAKSVIFKALSPTDKASVLQAPKSLIFKPYDPLNPPKSHKPSEFIDLIRGDTEDENGDEILFQDNED